jgi:hypothetical protein
MLPDPSWLCFSHGRPSSFPESEIRVPLPAEQKLLQSLVTLARLMSKCATLIYKQHYKSLAPIWKAANEIRRDLLRFAEQQRKDLNFGLVGDPNTGEVGVCQTIMSTSKLPRTSPVNEQGLHLADHGRFCSVPPHASLNLSPILGVARQAAPGGYVFQCHGWGRRWSASTATLAGHSVRVLFGRNKALHCFSRGILRAERAVSCRNP